MPPLHVLVREGCNPLKLVLIAAVAVTVSVVLRREIPVVLHQRLPPLNQLPIPLEATAAVPGRVPIQVSAVLLPYNYHIHNSA
jgi:hypothetical protein